MTILLDTCEFLWLVTGDARLPSFVSGAVQNPANEVFLSVVSHWEICVKHSLGKLPLPDSSERYVPLQREKHRIASLSLDEGAVAKLVSLPAHHRDPFESDAHLSGACSRASLRKQRSAGSAISGEIATTFVAAAVKLRQTIPPRSWPHVYTHGYGTRRAKRASTSGHSPLRSGT
jgi:PIN domain nuclease of toxin-antitoxin system